MCLWQVIFEVNEKSDAYRTQRSIVRDLFLKDQSDM